MKTLTYQEWVKANEVVVEAIWNGMPINFHDLLYKWGYSEEDIKNEYKLNVKLMATCFYFDRRDDTDTLLGELYDRIEKEGGNLQFVYDVSDYIDALRAYDNRPFYG